MNDLILNFATIHRNYVLQVLCHGPGSNRILAAYSTDPASIRPELNGVKQEPFKIFTSDNMLTFMSEQTGIFSFRDPLTNDMLQEYATYPGHAAYRCMVYGMKTCRSWDYTEHVPFTREGIRTWTKTFEWMIGSITAAAKLYQKHYSDDAIMRLQNGL